MNGYIKYFENGGKNMPLVVKDDDVLDKYNETCHKIKEPLNTKFHNMPVYDEKHIKAKVREFNGVIKTNQIPKESVHYTCIACKLLILLWEWKKNYPQIYLEECKYKSKKIKMTKFTNTELQSESESESELESNYELEKKLESDFDSE